MNDIRIYYLRFLNIERDVNSGSVTQDEIPDLLARLKKLMECEPDLDKRFIEMNQQTLYPAALAEENLLRNQKTHNLYDRLARVR